MNDTTPTRIVWIVNEPFDLPDHSRSYKKGQRVLDDEATASAATEQKFRFHASRTQELDHDAIAAAADSAQSGNGSKKVKDQALPADSGAATPAP